MSIEGEIQNDAGIVEAKVTGLELDATHIVHAVADGVTADISRGKGLVNDIKTAASYWDIWLVPMVLSFALGFLIHS